MNAVSIDANGGVSIQTMSGSCTLLQVEVVAELITPAIETDPGRSHAA